MTTRPRLVGSLAGGAIVSCALMLGPVPVRAQDAADEIRERMEWLMSQNELSIEGEPILARTLLPEIYARVAFQPLWTDREVAGQLTHLAQSAVEQGLDPDDYPVDTLAGLLPERGLPEDAIVRAEFDVLATETLIRIAYQLRFGKVNPVRLFPAWNFARELSPGVDPVEALIELVQAGDLRTRLIEAIDRGPLYEDMVEALAAHREIAAAGGWPPVTSGPTLRAGMDDPRVAQLRSRLAVSGEVRTADVSRTSFDDDLETAMRAFQARHGLDVDGVVGPGTLAALNVSVESRIEQIRAALERARWVFDDAQTLEGRLVLVNIASAEVSFFEGEDIVWRSRAQIGRPYRQTPVFRDDIQYLVFNPDWTVPPGILRNDVLPRMLQDPAGYLTRTNMDLLTRDGRVVPVDEVDWANVGPGRFPYIVRQRPGPWNSMGTVKFMFPNPYFVFLHDTPSRALFDRAGRAFSSGCVRVQDPYGLAELLFDDATNWNRDSFQEILDRGRMRTVHLPKPVPVYLLYFTAEVDGEGGIRFFEDIYGRDEKLLAALNRDPEFEEAL